MELKKKSIYKKAKKETQVNTNEPSRSVIQVIRPWLPYRRQIKKIMKLNPRPT